MAELYIDNLRGEGGTIRLDIRLSGLTWWQTRLVYLVSAQGTQEVMSHVFNPKLWSRCALAAGTLLVYAGLCQTLVLLGVSADQAPLYLALPLAAWLGIADLLMAKVLYFYQFWFKLHLLISAMALLCVLGVVKTPTLREFFEAKYLVNYELFRKMAAT